MRQCPICSHTFGDAVDACPHDGESLLAPDPVLGILIDGKYRVHHRLGKGGQGAVYSAVHVHLQRPVALKVIRNDFAGDPAATERFKREARTLALMKHPNIVTVYDFGVGPPTGTYLVMEYLEGRTTREELMRRRRFEPAFAARVLWQACLAVNAAHVAGIIHRDIKPENLFLEMGPSGDVAVKVLDFGIAKLRYSYEGDAVTAAGSLIGTPAYMSPEQCRDEDPDARSDVYALGCVLYELLTGRPPFLAKALLDLLQMHVGAPPTPPSHYAPGVSEDLDAVVLQALAKSPRNRFQTTDALGQALMTAVGAAAVLPEAFSSSGSYIMRKPESEVLTGETATPVDADLQPTFGGPGMRANNLPGELTSFIGRERETGEVQRLLSGNRLLTLTGPGGAGKTRLSLRVASNLLVTYRDGAWLVELGPLGDPELVPQTVASALGLREESGRPLYDALAEYLHSKQVLLIFDNCEHVIDACADLAEHLLRACHGVRILATSQAALGVAGETTWFVPPLSLPEHEQNLESLAQSEAVRLFVERAKLSRPEFEITERNAAAVARVCTRLDGIPLALELAAARAKVLSVAQIADRLDDRFRLLGGSSGTGELRRRTLRATMDWSYDLLTDLERVVFNRLAVFAGGCPLEAAEVVCAGDPVDEADVLDLVSHLVDKSLVFVEEEAQALRYRMLETIRSYGAERLRASDEAARIQARHRDFFLDLAERAEAELSAPDQSVWLERLNVEHDNLRAALEWSRTDTTAPDAFLRLAGALAKFWYVRNYEREGIVWLREGLERETEVPPRVRAKALIGAGSLARVMRLYSDATAYLEEGLALYRSLGDLRAIATALNNIGFVAQWTGNQDRAERLHEEALAIAREAGDSREIATALNNLGVVARYRGEYDRALALFEESLPHFRVLGDKRYIAATLNNLGAVVGMLGDYKRSAELHEEHLALRRELGERQGIASALNDLGETLQRQGELERAADLLCESLRLYDEVGDKRGIAYVLESFVSLTAARGQTEHTLRLAGATAALREAIGSPLSTTEMADVDLHLEKARDALGEERVKAAIAAGRTMPVDRVISYALESSESK